MTDLYLDPSPGQVRAEEEHGVCTLIRIGVRALV
jgi:hypothetical protein